MKREARLIALLGKLESPADGVEDYCFWLGRALAESGRTLEVVHCRWPRGWVGALRALWRQSREWRGRWVLVQYTALMWSRRGFPVFVPVIIALLRLRGCRSCILLHDACPRAGRRWIDRLRLRVQLWLIRRAHSAAELVLVTIPKPQINWLPQRAPKVFFVPVGANLPPERGGTENGGGSISFQIPTVAVFCISTWPAARKQEVEAICHAMRSASAELGELGLLVMGRGAREAEDALRQGLSDSPVAVRVEGLLNGEELRSKLSSCDVLLFVRGPLSTRRGSGLAGIACGLPIVAYRGTETGSPLIGAGILFVPQDDLASLARELTALLRDEAMRRAFSERNVAVFREWFSWDKIAGRLIEALGYAGGGGLEGPVGPPEIGQDGGG